MLPNNNMEGDNRNRIVNAFLISAVIAIAAVVALTIVGELYTPLKDSLKAVFSHHWVGKGVLSFAGFYLLGLLLIPLSGRGSREITTLLYVLFWVALLGALSVIGFYYYETSLVMRG